MAAVCAVVIGLIRAAVVSGGSSTAAPTPVSVVVPTTLAYGARPGPAGTKLLTEMADLLTLAVPAGWRTPAPDSLTLPDELDRFAQEVPSLATLLHAERKVAAKSGIRLFAYQTSAPTTFVAVVSYSAPGAKPLSPSDAAFAVALANKKKTSNAAVSAAHLPVGEVLVLDSRLASGPHTVVVQDLVLVAHGRDVVVEMVQAQDADGAGVPPVFGQIAQSIRLS